MPKGKSVPIQNTSLFRAVDEDSIFSNEQKKQIQSSKTQKKLFQYVSKTCNEILNNGRNNDLLNEFESLLNNTGCGNITKERLFIQRKTPDIKNHCYYSFPEIEYEDPDAISYHLYMNMAMILNSRKKDYPRIKECTVGVTNNYFFCLKIKNNLNVEIELSGDWVTEWDLINTCESEMKYESALKAHSIAGHVFWPCKKKSTRTINIIRKNYSIRQTLTILDRCYHDEFEVEESLGENSDKELINAFIDNKDWFELFNNFKQYKDFFSLGVFLEENITSVNINKIMQSRFEELLSLDT